MNSITDASLNIYNGYSTIQQLNSGTYSEKSSRISSTISDRIAISQTAYKTYQDSTSANVNAEAVLAELGTYGSCRITFGDTEKDLVKRLSKLASTKFDKFMTTVDTISSSDPETVLKGLAGLMDVKNTEMQSAIQNMSYKEYKNLRNTMVKITGEEDAAIKKIMENIMSKLEVTDS